MAISVAKLFILVLGLAAAEEDCAPTHGHAMLQRARQHAERSYLHVNGTTNATNGSAIIDMVDACLAGHTVGASDHEQKLWELVRIAEIVLQLQAANVSVAVMGNDWPDDAGVLNAAIEAGRDAAEELIRLKFEAEADEILSQANLSQAAIDHFLHKLSTMAEMCNHSLEASSLAHDEEAMLHPNMTMEEARVAADLAAYVEGFCQSEVLDLDFFVGHISDSVECNALVKSSHLLQMQKHMSTLDFYAKASLVLHDQENHLGHHFADRLQRRGDAAIEKHLMKAVLKHGTHPARMAQLRYLDRKYYDAIHGFTKEKYCESNANLKAERPGHWISQNQEIQAYVKCLCHDGHAALWCDAEHAEPLALLQPKVVEDLKEEGRKLALAQSGSVVGLGPCQDADGNPAPFDCTFCINGDNCVSSSGSYSVDVFSSIKEMLGTSASCMKGFCTPCKGVKPGDPFQFKMDIGVDVSKCGSYADFLATYNYFAELKLCIGGVMGEAADKIGWSLCHSIGKVTYYPFISKLHFTMSLPIPLPAPLGVRASLTTNLNLGDISRACDDHCDDFGPSQHFRCLQEFYQARGVTGVDFRVEVLLGVSIPFVGTVGKWFKVLGFDFWEDDNSREIAKNKAGVTIEYIGPSPWRHICGRTYSGVNCEPWAGDGDNRANDDCRGCGDDFKISRPDPYNSRSLCIFREDHNGGWGMNLELACPVDNSQLKVIVPIGSSTWNTKCAYPSEPVNCRSDAGNQGVRLGFDTNPDSYSVYGDGHRICARRTDHGGGWGQNLQLECDPAGSAHNFQISNIHMGSSHSNKRCLLITDEMSCDAHTADAAYRTNDDCRHCGDSFFVHVDSSWGYVCAQRTDHHGGWGLNLWFNCRNMEKNVRYRWNVDIGNSHHNSKCQWGHLPAGHSIISCASYAANEGYRRNDNYYAPDRFEVTTNGGNVCVRRLDYHGGWGMDLKISCILPR